MIKSIDYSKLLKVITVWQEILINYSPVAHKFYYARYMEYYYSCCHQSQRVCTCLSAYEYVCNRFACIINLKSFSFLAFPYNEGTSLASQAIYFPVTLHTQMRNLFSCFNSY